MLRSVDPDRKDYVARCTHHHNSCGTITRRGSVGGRGRGGVPILSLVCMRLCAKCEYFRARVCVHVRTRTNVTFVLPFVNANIRRPIILIWNINNRILWYNILGQYCTRIVSWLWNAVRVFSTPVGGGRSFHAPPTTTRPLRATNIRPFYRRSISHGFYTVKNPVRSQHWRPNLQLVFTAIPAVHPLDFHFWPAHRNVVQRGLSAEYHSRLINSVPPPRPTIREYDLINWYHGPWVMREKWKPWSYRSGSSVAGVFMGDSTGRSKRNIFIRFFNFCFLQFHRPVYHSTAAWTPPCRSNHASRYAIPTSFLFIVSRLCWVITGRLNQ